MIAYIGLGSNLEKPLQQLELARSHIAQFASVTQVSSIYVSAPISDIPQQDFYNQVIAVKTTLSPIAMLQSLLEIEKSMGRIRLEKWGPRIIDCDLLLADHLEINTPALQLPHPRITERAFVLLPLLEIAPQATLPLGEPLANCLKFVQNQVIQKYE